MQNVAVKIKGIVRGTGAGLAVLECVNEKPLAVGNPFRISCPCVDFIPMHVVLNKNTPYHLVCVGVAFCVIRTNKNTYRQY